MNVPITPLPWVLHEQGEPNQYAILTPDRKTWVLGLIHNGEVLDEKQLANLRFIIHAVNNHHALVNALSSACDDLEALVPILEGRVAAMPVTRDRLDCHRVLITKAKESLHE